MQLSETDIRCDVCGLRIKTENGEKVEQRDTFHFHTERTIKPLNLLEDKECDEYARRLWL